MNLKKRKLLISIFFIIFFAVISFNGIVFADGNSQGIPFTTYADSQNNNGNTQTVPVIETTETPNNTNENNTNTPEKLANTGLEDAPWLLIGLCVVSAIFAYQKVKEYKSI